VGLKLLLHETGPQTSRRAELGDFFEQVGERGEEKGQARRELIEVQSHGQRPPHVLEAVRERERHLLRRRRARLPHVIARHGDRIDAQALDRDEPAHVDREAQRRLDRIDVRAARDELLEDVVLDGALQNDILKEFIARGTYIYPIEPSLRLAIDVCRFVTIEGLSVNPISVSGYHMREAGATAAQEVAFTFANGLEYVRRALAVGLDLNQFAPR